METQDSDIKEKVTPSASQAEEKTKQSSSQSGDGDGETSKNKNAEEKEHMIPKHRFDEVAEKARLGERAMEELTELRKTFAQLGGGKSAARELEDDAKGLADKYGLKDDFIQDMLVASTARAKREMAVEVKTIKESQAHNALAAEMQDLGQKFPEATSMTKEERAEFLKMAVDPRYHRVPLEDLWKIKTFGRPAGKSKTVESGRGGAGHAADEEPDIKGMSLDEFEKYSADMAKKKK